MDFQLSTVQVFGIGSVLAVDWDDLAGSAAWTAETGLMRDLLIELGRWGRGERGVWLRDFRERGEGLVRAIFSLSSSCFLLKRKREGEREREHNRDRERKKREIGVAELRRKRDGDEKRSSE